MAADRITPGLYRVVSSGSYVKYTTPRIISRVVCEVFYDSYAHYLLNEPRQSGLYYWDNDANILALIADGTYQWVEAVP